MKNQKKNIVYILFIALALCICLTPFVCMTFAKTDATPENRRLAAFPSVKKKDGSPNIGVMSDLGAYFEDHFAFRNQIVAADGTLQSLFGVCASDSVVKGNRDWLYYTSSVPDFQRTNLLSDKAIRNAAHNLELTQELLSERDIAFLVTVAPNKNSLYPSEMPYYLLPGSGDSNADRLSSALKEYGVHYVDLFAAFRDTDETLYLKRDSHWNEKGAVLAYDTILSAAGKPHDPYDDVAVLRTKTEVGDLGKMAYSVAAPAEWNASFDVPFSFRFTTDGSDVEDAYLSTECEDGSGSLLMFRDSFGNTLLPYFAQSFEKCVFSKATPYTVEKYVGQSRPDTVIIEKVERNLRDFAFQAPVIAAAPVKEIQIDSTTQGGFKISSAPCAADPELLEITGTVFADDYDGILLKINNKYYKAFLVSADGSDNGFAIYLPKSETIPDSVELFLSVSGRVYAVENGGGDAK